MEPQSLHRIGELLDMLERTTGEPGELASTLQHIAETAQRFFSVDDCTIYAINPITGHFVDSMTITASLVESEAPFTQPGLEGLTQDVLQQGMLFVEHLAEMPEHHNAFTLSKGVQSFVGLALSMNYNQKPLGVLYLNFKDPQHFSLDDQELFRLFAEQASYILQETWLVRRYREVARIGYEINQELATANALFQKLLQHVVGILDTSYTFLLAIYLLPTNMLEIYTCEEGETHIYRDYPPKGAIQHVIQTQKTFFGRHMSEEEEQLPFQRVSIPETGRRESVIFVPLVLRGVPLGALSIQHPEPNVYNKEDRFILELLGNHIALALYNMRLYDSLTHLNEAGQFLTQQIDSAQVLQETVDRIWQATRADSVILYPYDSTLRQFMLPPRMAGLLLDATPLHATFLRPYDIAVLALSYATPIFAKQCASIYTILQGSLQGEPINFQQREKVQSVAIVPLSVGEVSVGVLFLNFRQSQYFDTPQKLLIEGLAHYAAIAIKNAQVFGALGQRRVRELEILQSIDRELSRTLDLNTVLDIILRLALEYVPAEEASILLYYPQIRMLETAAAIGRYAEASRAQVIFLDETKAITRWVVEHRAPVRVSNVYQELPWRDLHLPVALDTISELDVPMLDGVEVVGVLNFESTREAAFSREEEIFLITLAGQAVLAIKNAQAYEREKHFAEEAQTLAKEAQVLNDISKEITNQIDSTHVFDFILEKALVLTHSSLGSLHLYNPHLDDLEMVAGRGVANDKMGMHQSSDEGIVGYVVKNKRLLNVEYVSQAPWKEIYIQFSPGVSSELAVPMFERDEIRGVLNVESLEIGHFAEKDERLLRGLADLAVVALQSTERYKKAIREAEHFEMLYEAGRELANITDWKQLEQAYDIILHIAEKHTPCQVVIRNYDDNTQELVLIRASQYQRVPPFSHMKLDEGLNGQVYRERQTIVMYDTRNPSPSIALKLSDTAIRSLFITPIQFKDRYYGNLALGHREAGYFHGSEISFFQGLADQLASTIYRLETTKARLEFEQISSVGHSTFELTHRLANDLALVQFYTSDIEWRLGKLGITDAFIDEKLNDIVASVQGVLTFSDKLKRALVNPVEEEPVLMTPQELFKEATVMPSLPSNIQIRLQIDEGVGPVLIIPSQVSDILRNLVANAVDALTQGGQVILCARNSGHFVALTVADTGSGILPQHQPKIFDLSFSTKGSSGFGLWSARRNALRNHGDLRVECESGCTTFTLLLPRTDGGTI